MPKGSAPRNVRATRSPVFPTRRAAGLSLAIPHSHGSCAAGGRHPVASGTCDSPPVHRKTHSEADAHRSWKMPTVLASGHPDGTPALLRKALLLEADLSASER